jgi:hypothetical protein
MSCKLDAERAIVNHLASCLPPGAPQIYRAIHNPHFVTRERKQVAIAELELFDGQAATIEVFIWNFGVAHRWTRLDGGNAFFANGRWQRESAAL